MLRSGNSYDSRTQPEISTHEKEITREKTGRIEGSEDNIMRVSPELVDQRIKASLEPLHAQITALNEMMDRLIQSNSEQEITTASYRRIRHQYESPYSEVPGSSSFPTVAPLTTAVYSRDSKGSFFEVESLFSSPLRKLDSYFNFSWTTEELPIAAWFVREF